MSSVNKIILVGRAGKDPEIRHTNAGKPVSNLSIATSEKFNVDGDRREETEWHSVVFWGKLAEIANQYLKKGALVYVEGRVKTSEWADSNGEKRTKKEVVASTMRMLGGGNGDNNKRLGSGDNETMPF